MNIVWAYIKKGTGDISDPRGRLKLKGLGVSILLLNPKDIVWSEVELVTYSVMLPRKQCCSIIVVRDCGLVLLNTPDMSYIKRAGKRVCRIPFVFFKSVAGGLVLLSFGKRVWSVRLWMIYP